MLRFQQTKTLQSSFQSTLHFTIISIANVTSLIVKLTNIDARLHWPSGEILRLGRLSIFAAITAIGDELRLD